MPDWAFPSFPLLSYQQFFFLSVTWWWSHHLGISVWPLTSTETVVVLAMSVSFFSPRDSQATFYHGKINQLINIWNGVMASGEPQISQVHTSPKGRISLVLCLLLKSADYCVCLRCPWIQTPLRHSNSRSPTESELKWLLWDWLQLHCSRRKALLGHLEKPKMSSFPFTHIIIFYNDNGARSTIWNFSYFFK